MNSYDVHNDNSTHEVEVSTTSIEEKYDLREQRYTNAELDSEYGDSQEEESIVERTLQSESVPHNDFYRRSIRRQNFCFGISLFNIVIAFVAAYFLIGSSFTPSNIHIFGDESTMNGGSGEVGIDADNADAQAIIDEEISQVERAGNWGESANDKQTKVNERFKDIINHHDTVGHNSWTEKRQWWLENKDHLDETKMSKKEKRIVDHMKRVDERRKKREELLQLHSNRKNNNTKKSPAVPTDLDVIVEKLTEQYNYTGPGFGKQNFPGLDNLGPSMRGKHHQQNHQDRPEQSKKIKPQRNKKDKPNRTKNQNHKQEKHEPLKEINERTEEFATNSTNAESGDDKSNQMEDNSQTSSEQYVKAMTSNFTILEQVGHDKASFTCVSSTEYDSSFDVSDDQSHTHHVYFFASVSQGISYGNDGFIYETTGLYGQSKIIKIDPKSFKVKISVDLEKKYFGEGSSFYIDSGGNSRLIHITWKEQTGFIYDPNTLETLETFQYTTSPPKNEGWGITYDPIKYEFIVSDGSSYLYFWDRDTLKEKRKVEVTRFNGKAQSQLNELEWMDGLICCNIWHVDEIICVDPNNGKSVREYDMTSLWPKKKRGGSENVLNGIALGLDHVIITGKNWDRMYKVAFPDWPTLFDG